MAPSSEIPDALKTSVQHVMHRTEQLHTRIQEYLAHQRQHAQQATWVHIGDVQRIHTAIQLFDDLLDQLEAQGR